MMNKPIVVTISGMGGSGKSTFISLCKKINENVIEASIVDFVKDVAIQCGWDGTKTEKNRKFLSDLKDLLDEWDDVPRKKTDEFILSNSDKIIFVNAREASDIEYYKEKYNALTLLIKNPRVSPIITNHADRDTENFFFNIEVINDEDFKKLERAADTVLEFVLAHFNN